MYSPDHYWNILLYFFPVYNAMVDYLQDAMEVTQDYIIKTVCTLRGMVKNLPLSRGARRSLFS